MRSAPLLALNLRPISELITVTDSTHTVGEGSRLGRRRLWHVLVAGTAATLALGSFATQALADGDPASDVLTVQPLYLPQDANVAAAQQTQLGAVLAAARRSGYRTRVAIIASPTDLGSVTELWRAPQSYAHFLDLELSLVYRGPVLVVMPNGYGLYGGAASLEAERAALRRLPAPGGALGTATVTAIQRLAAAAGHPFVAVARITRSSSAPADPIPWIVVGAGAILILLAWGASFRARPLQLGRSGPRPS